MKKVIFCALIASIITSCKKEQNFASEEVIMQDSIIAPVKDSLAMVPSQYLKTLTLNDATAFLNTKNDTLYVTNFFATWCGPCVREIPHFRDKITEYKDQPVKISFVSLDVKDAWAEDVPKFVDKHQIRNNTYLLDGESLNPEWFSSNFKQWDGSAIPFTFMRKGEKTDEFLGMMTEDLLDKKIKSFR